VTDSLSETGSSPITRENIVAPNAKTSPAGTAFPLNSYKVEIMLLNDIVSAENFTVNHQDLAQ
jgi:hypothetical protein